MRTVAVLPVVAFHAGMPVFHGGFAGVDVFFVISGFLITGIIAEEIENRRFSIARFYERRARRILPALFFMMLFTTVLSWLVMVPYQLEDLAQSILATVLFASNILFWFEADYFSVEAATKPLLHTWSLAVEEQFYVFFPLLLMLLYRFGRQSIIPALAVLGALSLAAALYLGPQSPSASFFLIQFRAWELVAGALAALWMRNGAPAANPGIAAAALLAVVVSFFVTSEDSAWPGPLTFLPVVGTALILLFARSEAGIGRVLAWEPMRRIGLVSYSLYLWHLPPLALLQIRYFGDVPVAAAILAVVFACVMAWVSWRFVEQPFRRPGRIDLLPFVGSAALALLPLVAFGMLGVGTTGYQSYLVSRIPDAYAAQVIDREAEVAARELVWGPVVAAASAPFEADDRQRVLILGDSLSGDLIVATGGHQSLYPETQFRRVRLDDTCMAEMVPALGGAVPRGDGRCAREIRNLLEKDLLGTADEIVLAANWQPETMENGIALAEALSVQGQVISLLGVAAFNDMASLSMQLHSVQEPLGRFFYRNIRSKYLAVNVRLASAAANDPQIRYLDKLGLYCEDAAQSCDLLDSTGKPAIFDAAHLTVRGVEIMAARIRQNGWFK